MKIDIAGVKVDNVNSAEALELIKGYVQSGQPHQIVTAYSEFVVEAQTNPAFKNAINNASLVLPDGVGIVWAAKFLSQPKRDLFVTYFNWLGSLFSIILAPNSTYSVIKEKVSGSRIVWDIARIAEANNYTLALYGGFEGVAEKAAEKLRARFPNIKINLAASDKPFDSAAVERIAVSNSDILLIAYQPPKQELWLSDNLTKLNVKVAIGLGGTFDYMAGKQEPVPEFLNKFGLEWFWRLITQPWRINRMWKAIPVFAWLILNYKDR